MWKHANVPLCYLLFKQTGKQHIKLYCTFRWTVGIEAKARGGRIDVERQSGFKPRSLSRSVADPGTRRKQTLCSPGSALSSKP